MNVKLKSLTPDAEVNIVEIARVSSSRSDKTEHLENLINYLIKNKHWSPFEHSYMTVEIETSKAIGIQLLRHRSFTFQEFSQRYSKVEKMEPIELRQQAVINRQSSTDLIDPLIYRDRDLKPATASAEIADYIKKGRELYNILLDLGVAKECARMILPMCSSTTIFMTGSIRSWIHFLDIRLDEHAQKEARLIAQAIRDIFTENLPIIAKARGYGQ
jgi:thymidylate synthase (FAD)